MPDPNKNKKEIKFSTAGALTGSKPTHGSIVSPIIRFTSKVAGAIGSFFGKPTAGNRPGVKPIGNVSTLTPSGIIRPTEKYTGGAKVVNQGTLKESLVTKINPAAARAKAQSNYLDWRPTSFPSIMAGFSGISSGMSGPKVRTGVTPGRGIGSFGFSGTRSLSQVKAGQKVYSSGWNMLSGYSTKSSQGKGYGFDYRPSKGSGFGISMQRSLFPAIVGSQIGTGLMSPTFLQGTRKKGITGIGSPEASPKSYKDPASKKSLFIQHAYSPQFLHTTLGNISGAIKSGSPTWKTTKGTTTKTTTHPLSVDYEIYKGYMNKYFSNIPGKGKGYTTETPKYHSKTFSSDVNVNEGILEGNFKKMVSSYGKRTSSGEIPTISQYSMDLVGYDILKPPGKK